jgi:hypothetical protein
MSSDTIRWCPSCQRLTHNIVAAPAAYEVVLFDEAEVDAPRVTKLMRYCQGCGEVWASVEAPLTLLEDLLRAEEKLQESKRQLAMLRLLLARDRHAAETEARQTIPLRRAA